MTTSVDAGTVGDGATRKKIQTFDDILPYIGDAGRYQWFLFLLLLPFAFVYAFLYFTQFFLTLTPNEHWCTVPEFNGWNVTDHRKFPKDEKLRLKWVLNMGWSNWMPKKYDALCSLHFSQDSIDRHDHRARLRKGSVPIFYDRDKENVSPLQSSPSIKHLDKKKKTDSCESINEPGNSSQIQRTSLAPINLVTNDENTAGTKGALSIVSHDHTYTMCVETLARKLEAATSKADRLVNDKKKLLQKEKRYVKQRLKLKDIIKDMRATQSHLEDGLYCLDGFGNIAVELFTRMHKNITQGSLTKDKYPPELRCFALTLHFYSPAAYNYVRKSLNLALPHPSVIRSWYSSIDAEPGFSEECFNTLKLKSQEYKKINKPLICALVMDEMGIKKGFQRTSDGAVRGYVDIGTGSEGNSDLREAKDALVLLVVPLNDTWKLPIGFFLINGMGAEAKKNIIREALIRLHEVGIQITSVTLDGPPEHLAAVNSLGANMTMGETCKSYFPHPVEKQPDVHVIIDPCHDLKNIRNALGDLSVILDEDNNRIQWIYIKALAQLQQEEGLRLGNRLRTAHVEYKKMIMKVYLAAQTLSSSVADAIEFCWKVLGLPEFKDCEATVRFIRVIDRIFDFLNSRNPWGKGYKSPLKAANEFVWRERILEDLRYLSTLKLLNNRPIYSSPRRTGFIGFYTAVLSTISIFDQYVKPTDSPLSMLLTYRLSQDHIELLFAAIRARSGWCPNPTAAQFISAYKRLLIRHDVNISSGNTQVMDQVKILSVSSHEKKKRVARIERYDPKIYNAVENRRVASQYGLDDDGYVSNEHVVDDLENYLNFAWAVPNTLSEFSDNAVGYIAGFVVRKLSKTVKCDKCLQACKDLSWVSRTENLLDTKKCGIALTIMKNRGGLIVASKSVIEVCRVAERLLRKACNSNLGKPPKELNFPALLANKAFEEVLLSKMTFFPDLDDHFRDSFVSDSCINHMFILTKSILMHYIETRMNAMTKNAALSVTGTNVRHFLTRQIVWAHQ